MRRDSTPAYPSSRVGAATYSPQIRFPDDRCHRDDIVESRDAKGETISALAVTPGDEVASLRRRLDEANARCGGAIARVAALELQLEQSVTNCLRSDAMASRLWRILRIRSRQADRASAKSARGDVGAGAAESAPKSDILLRYSQGSISAVIRMDTRPSGARRYLVTVVAGEAHTQLAVLWAQTPADWPEVCARAFRTLHGALESAEAYVRKTEVY
jgi:hypothetical protein